MTQMTTTEMLTGIRDWALSKFVTASVSNLVNYYLKSETYSKTEVNALVNAIKQFRYELAATLPEPPSADTMGIIYLVPSASPEQRNIKDEFITVLESGTYKWEQIGSTSIDLSNYYTKGQTDSAISTALNNALAAYTTTANLTTLLAAKQDTIQDLAAIRSGASAGATAVQPAAMSAALVATVAESGVYDVTANNDNAKFASLSALLSSENLNTLIPVASRKGGMSIKFVLTSDNKYMRYNLLTDEFSTDVEDWQGVDDVPTANSKNLVTSGGVYDALLGEYVVVTATANTGSVATAMVGIYDVNDVLIVEGEGEVTARILYGKTYKVKCSRVYDYLTPAEQTFTASIQSRQVTMQYTYIERDTITIDQTVSNEQSMISGDVQGDVIKAIRAASHLYLGKQTEAGNQLICQLSDTDGTKYHDGTTAAMNGSEGDQWLKLPVFWWKVTGIGTPDANDTYDQYSFSFAFAGEPDPTWHKWEGDMNLLGAKKMYVTGNKGYSRSGIQGSANFTQAQGNSYAAARGTGYSCVTWEWQWMMCILFYAWYGRMNSQAQCGSGSNSSTRTLGTKDSLGMTDTTSANGNSDNTKFWGIENWWGELTEWIGNITSQDYVVTIVDMNTKQSRTVSGWYQFGGTGGYASRFKVTDLLDFIPRAKNGTETTCYCDWVNGKTGSSVVRRSGSSADASGGVACVISNAGPSYAGADIGSRLAFNGVITEAESVAAYKAALA